MKKFKEYLMEKITKKEFDEALKNVNLRAGCEFEFYVNEEKLDDVSSNFDTDYIEDRLLSLNDEVENVVERIADYEESVKDLENEKNALIEEIEKLKKERELEKSSDKIDEIDDKISDLEFDLEEYEDGTKLEELERSIEPYPVLDDFPAMAEIFNYFEEKDLYWTEYSDSELEQKLFLLYDDGFFYDEVHSIPDGESLISELHGINIQQMIYDLENMPYADGELGEDQILEIEPRFPFNPSDFEIKGDGSLDNGNGVEIVTDTVTLPKLIEIIEEMFEWIDEVGYTNRDTGFHVHMSYKDNNSIIDPLKLLLFTEEGKIYNEKFFVERMNNTYAESIITGHLNHLERITTKDFKDSIKSDKKLTNKLANDNRYIGVNLVDLEKNHVEFRYMGATDYHKKFKEVREIIGNYAHWLSIACDPNYKRKEYIKKLNRLVNYFNYQLFSTLKDEYMEEVEENKDKLKEIYGKKMDKAVKDNIKKIDKILKNLPKYKIGKLKSYKLNTKIEATVSELMDNLLKGK